MRRAAFSFLVLTLSSILVSCATPSLVPFTQELRNQYSLEPDDIRQLQYYVSQTVTLQRDLAKSESSVTKGHGLKIINDRRVEVVTVNPLTPGVAEGIDPDSVAISFEPGESLRFGASDGSNISGPYRLYANWKSGAGALHYSGKEFQAVGTSPNAQLLVDLRQLNRFERTARTVKGRRLPRA